MESRIRPDQPSATAGPATLFHPPLPRKPGERLQWGQLYGLSDVLAIASAAREFDGLILVLTDDVQNASQLTQGLRFFIDDETIPALLLPDWETLPYDVFSPLPELISQRLQALHRIGGLKKGVLTVPVSTALQRLPPRSTCRPTPSC